MPGGRHSLQNFSTSAHTTGDTTAGAAVAGKTIYVTSIALIARAAASEPVIKSGTTAIAGPFAFAINGGFAISAPGDDSWLVKTNPGEALVYGQAVDGCDGFITFYYG